MANAGLVGRWRLDEGAGTLIGDSSGSGLDGQLRSLSGADPTFAWVSGGGPWGGWTLNFTRDQFVVIDRADLATLEPCVISVEARVKSESNPGNIAYVLSKGAEGGSFASYAFYTGREDTDGLCFYVCAPFYDLQSPRVSPERIWDGKWHHVVGTFDGRIVRLYLDGIEQRPGTVDPTPSFITYLESTNHRFYIGMYRNVDSADAGLNLGITAMISDVLIWRGVLTAEEVAARYANADLP